MNTDLPLYWVFAGDIYYPLGGIDDLRGTFLSLEQAKVAAELPQNGWLSEYAWCHIVEVEDSTPRRYWVWVDGGWSEAKRGDDGMLALAVPS